jgi:hypothetical protein
MDEQARWRHVDGMRQRIADSDVRNDLLKALHRGKELSAPELRAKLSPVRPLSVVNYHLLVLREAEAARLHGLVGVEKARVGWRR